MTDEIKVMLKKTEADQLYDSLVRLIGNNKITTFTVVTITTNMMQVVERYPKLTGTMKKELVTHVIKRFVYDNLGGEDEDSLILFIDKFLPSVIDMIVSIDKKESVIDIRKGFKSCFPCC
tara:strand:+ start:1235 stop:1594 length:360 start_codon:yes stop_codon:yes gene_type:complete